MHILTLFCSTIFIKNHQNKAEDDFNTINSYFQKRFKKNTFNKLTRKFLQCKIQYLKETMDFKEMIIVSKYSLELVRLNFDEENLFYAEACGVYADALSLNGQNEESLKWNEKKLSINKSILTD